MVALGALIPAGLLNLVFQPAVDAVSYTIPTAMDTLPPFSLQPPKFEN